MDPEDKLNQISQIAFSTLPTLHHTYNMAKEMQSIDGCFVECGVAGGAQLMAMALTYTRKDIIGFDSFEGIPMAGINDEQQPGIGIIKHDMTAPITERLVSSGQASYSVNTVMENFAKYEVGCPTLRLIRGWFQNTLPKFQPVPIALLRLDGDLYESTLICLKYLYPLVSVGGCVIIDDHALPGTEKAVKDYFDDNMPELLDVDGGLGVKYFYKK